jgi:predicted MFS family arabinose efflux permease
MRRLLVPAVLANVAAPLPPFLVGALGVEVRRDLHLSTTALGIAVTAFFFTTAALSPVTGRLADRAGWLRPLRYGSAGTTLALLALAVTSSVVWLVAALALAGVANSIVVPATNAALAAAIQSHRLGLAVGISQASVPLSGVVAGLCVPLAAGRIPWGWLICACAALPAAAAVTFALYPSTLDSRGVAGTRTPVVAAPSTTGRALGWATVAAALATVLVSVLGTLFVILVVSSGTSPAMAGLLLAVGGVTGALVRTATGAFTPDLAEHGMRVMQSLLACAIVGAVLLATGVGSVGWVFVATVLVFAGGWGWPAAFYGSLLRRHKVDPAGATGRALTGMAIGAIVGPAVFGAVVEHGSSAIAWVGLAVVAGAAALTGRRSDGLYRA